MSNILPEAKELLRWMRSRLRTVIPNASNGREIRADCPLCVSRGKKPDVKQHLYVSKTKKVGHCFRCGWKGMWWHLVMEVDECTYEEAIAQLHGVPLLEDYDSTLAQLFNQNPYEEEVNEDDFEIVNDVPEDFVALSYRRADPTYQEKVAIKYLQHRGVDDEFIFCGMFGVVPGELRVYLRASPMYWQGRALHDSIKPKYTNPPFPVGDVLGLWDSLHLAPWFSFLRGPIYITEGLLSGLAVIQRGHPALALLGKTANGAQFQRLLTLPRPLVVMLDGGAPEEGRELAWKLTEAGRPDVVLATLESGDPADCWDFDETEMHLATYVGKSLELVTGGFKIPREFPRKIP